MVEALELKAGIVLQNPGLESPGLHRSFEQRDPLVQIVDGVGTTALLADAELDVTGACFGKSSSVGPGRGRLLRRRSRPASLAVALDAEVPRLLDVIPIAPTHWLERELTELSAFLHLAHVDERAAWMTPDPESGVPDFELMHALVPEWRAWRRALRHGIRATQDPVSVPPKRAKCFARFSYKRPQVVTSGSH